MVLYRTVYITFSIRPHVLPYVRLASINATSSSLRNMNGSSPSILVLLVNAIIFDLGLLMFIPFSLVHYFMMFRRGASYYIVIASLYQDGTKSSAYPKILCTLCSRRHSIPRYMLYCFSHNGHFSYKHAFYLTTTLFHRFLFMSMLG